MEEDKKTIYEICKACGGVHELEVRIQQSCNRYAKKSSVNDYIEHIITKRDYLINGYELKEYDAFFNGYYSALTDSNCSGVEI